MEISFLSYADTLISFSCFSCKTLKVQAFVFLLCVRTKRESWSQAFLPEMVETGDKNCNVPQQHALFCEESLGKIDVKVVKLFQNGSVHKFYCLKALITLEQVNTSLKTLMVRL